MLTPKNFICNRKCGRCCIVTVVLLLDEDIKRIKKQGFSQDFFVDYEMLGEYRGKPSLKKNKDGWCVFLKKDKKGIFSCGIYENRPQICKKYPFFGEKKICIRHNIKCE